MNISMVNEKELLSKAIIDGHIAQKPTDTIRVLIKYYFKDTKDKVKVMGAIHLFMQKNFKKYKPRKWEKLIKNMVETISKQSHELNVVDSISITQKELDTIKSIDDNNLEKLAFVSLVYAKVKNKLRKSNNNWVNQSNQSLLKEAKISGNKQDKNLLVHELVKRDLIKNTHVVDKSGFQVLFVDEESDESDIVISDFREIVFHYLRWKGVSIGNCSQCSVMILKKSNCQKYCNECKRKKDLEWKRENMRKKRSVE